MTPTDEQRKAAEDKVRRIVHKHRRRAFHETCDPKLIMLDEQTRDIIDAMSALLARREAEAYQRGADDYEKTFGDAVKRREALAAHEAAQAVVRAVAETTCYARDSDETCACHDSHNVARATAEKYPEPPKV